ncbi:PilZ domain-containing protein [bacterium CPR1]|nr:PilZ domain-containing protein [bacterium CPR1]
MLSWRTRTTLLEVQGDRATVLSSRPVDRGREVALDGKARLTVEGCRPHSQGGYVLSGVARDANRLPMPPAPPEGVRRRPRAVLRSRVMSAQLPGYRAVTRDCSVTGLLLEAEGPVSPGTRLSLEIELESVEIPLRTTARAVWCEQDVPKRWLVGVELVQPDAGLVHLLKQLTGEPAASSDEGHGAQASGQRPVTAPPLPRSTRRAELVAQLRHYRFEPSGLKVDIVLPHGTLHCLEIPEPRSLRDNRPLAGTQLSFLEYEQDAFQAVYRLQSPWNEVVLEVTAAPGSQEIWRGLPPLHPRRIRLALS